MRAFRTIHLHASDDPEIDEQYETCNPKMHTALEESGAKSIVQTVANKLGMVCINAGTGVLTARWLKPSGRGELAAMILWPLLLSSLTTLGIPSSLIYYLRREPQAANKHIATGFLMSLALSVLASVIGAVCLPFWLGRQYDAHIIRYSQWFLVIVPVLATTIVGRVVLEAKGLFSLSNRLLLLSPATTLAILLLLVGTHRLLPTTAGMAYMFGAIPPFLLMIVWVLPLINAQLRTSKQSVRVLLGYGLRSFGVDVLGTLALQVDQVLVIAMLSPRAMGAYGVLLSLSRMFNLFQGSVVMVLFPKAAGQTVGRVIELTERSARISTAVTAMCCLMVALSGSVIVRLLYGREYVDNSGTLRILLAEVTLTGAVFILAQAFMALNYPGMVTSLQAIGLATSVPLMLWLVPRMGIQGAALALLISTVVRFVLVYFGFRFILKVRLPRLVPRARDLKVVLAMFQRRQIPYGY